jgi:hypothetical protein
MFKNHLRFCPQIFNFLKKYGKLLTRLLGFQTFLLFKVRWLSVRFAFASRSFGLTNVARFPRISQHLFSKIFSPFPGALSAKSLEPKKYFSRGRPDQRLKLLCADMGILMAASERQRNFELTEVLCSVILVYAL